MFDDDSIAGKADDTLHEEKGRWEERIDRFRDNLRERLDERDADINPEYDESVDERV